MCGLFGLSGNEKFALEDLQHARDARESLVHRGPDMAGECILGTTYLGFRRLSIIDTSEAGSQPMVSGELAITVNGEIYNFRQLRAELEAHGHIFRSRSDSEVVLHGYRQWGIEGLARRLDGMYAAVIVDNATRQIYALRDRAGIKPLYYYFDGSLLVWASELKAIVTYMRRSPLSVDNTAVIDFLTYRYIPAPKSIYKNVYKLPPASLLQWKIGSRQVSVSKYWKLEFAEIARPINTMKEELRRTLSSSVKEQLVSDVPLGLLLSGGIDSSAVTLMASKFVQGIRSFSIAFEGTERDETPFAEMVALKSGTLHEIHRIAKYEMDNVLRRIIGWFDEPFGDSSAVPTHRVCEVARRSTTVVLSGDGGDELFGGYRWYQRYNRLRQLNRFWPSQNANGVKLPSALPLSKLLHLTSVSDPIRQWALLRGALKPGKLEAWKRKLEIAVDYDELWAYRACFRNDLSPRQAARVMDFHTYLPDDILTKVDRASMVVSLECRPPFLSKEMIEFAFSLPESFIFLDNQLKGGLKESLRGLVPNAILDRGKQGFGVPDFGWKKNLASQHGSFGEAMVREFLGEVRPTP